MPEFIIESISDPDEFLKILDHTQFSVLSIKLQTKICFQVLFGHCCVDLTVKVSVSDK